MGNRVIGRSGDRVSNHAIIARSKDRRTATSKSNRRRRSLCSPDHPISRSPDSLYSIVRFNAKERAVIPKCRTPRQVQAFLRDLPYNWEKGGETLRTFRGVVRHWSAHCLEGALTAATILEQHGYPPLLLDLESQDKLDHVLFLFRRRGKWGTVARSRDAGLHGRKPVFRTVRQLVMSYVDPYVDGSGRITGYGVGDLRILVKGDWRLSEKNIWEVERALIKMPHKKLKTSDRRYAAILKQFRAYKATHPEGPVTFYSNKYLWL